MKFRTLREGDGTVVEVSAPDAQCAAEEAAEKAFNLFAGEFTECTIYVEDRDGELLAFDVSVRMEPVFDAEPSEDDVPANVLAAFGRGN